MEKPQDRVEESSEAAGELLECINDFFDGLRGAWVHGLRLEGLSIDVIVLRNA